MANNKVYGNYLMHGRTKGSRNGISNTKGYTAVGKKAKGKLVNGKYVYDTSSMMLGTTQTNNSANWQQAANATRAEQEQYNRWYGKGTQKSRGIAKPGLDPDLSNGARYDPNLISTISKGSAYTSTSPAYDAVKRKAENDAMRAKVASLVSTSAARGDAQQAALAQLRKQNQNNVAAKKKAQQAYDSAAKGAANNWQQQAAYQQQKDATRNRVAASAAKGAANDWQSKANAARAMTEYGRKAETARNAKEAARSASYNKMSSTQKNAMTGDPRYSKNSVDKISYEESKIMGRPTTGSIAGSLPGEAVDASHLYRTKRGGYAPYEKQIDKASNKQEYANAIAKQKSFDTAYKESKIRNSRSDIGNAVADFKEEAKAKAKSLFKKKKKK